MFGCYSLAEVTGTESESRVGCAGGLAGFAEGGYIVGCYFAGTAQAPVKAASFIGQDDGAYGIRGIYASGRVLIGGVEDSSLTDVYYGSQGGLTAVSLTADGLPDWEATTTELNNAITAYNHDHGAEKCEYHFVQTEGTSNPPALAEGEPGAN